MYESLMELMEPQIQVLTRKSWDEGLEQGRIQGQEQGRIQGQKMAAMRMLESGKYTPEEICDISGLSQDEVETLKGN